MRAIRGCDFSGSWGALPAVEAGKDVCGRRCGERKAQGVANGMTAEEIGFTADGILALLRSRHAKESRQERLARDAETIRLRLALAEEFGRHRGWTYDSRERGVQHLFGRRPAHYGRWEQVPMQDHASSYCTGSGCRTVALVSQPYGPLSEKTITEIRTWATERGLTFEMPNWPSWHYPEWTQLCIFTRIDDISKS